MKHSIVKASPIANGINALSTRHRAAAVRYEDSLADFTAASWASVEPAAFMRNWHIDAICEHLEAISDWQINRLLINMPPRHMKSLAANVFFPAWVWAQDPNPDGDPSYPFAIRRNSWRGPGVKFMHLSYENTLATRDGVKCRQVIKSSAYQQLWGHRYQLRPDQNQKKRFDNDLGGHRLSTSEGGVITGEGADIIVFDDPHNVRAVGGASNVAREKTMRFWDESMPSRLNDQAHGAFVVVMQRVHEKDLSGHILADALGWEHLCLPAVYEPQHPFPMRTSVIRKATGRVWSDPRNEGEALWPEKVSVEALHRIAKDGTMSSHMAAGQYQQRPTAREGGLFKRVWFDNPTRLVPDAGRLDFCRAWDLAATAENGRNDPDYTVGLLMARDRQTSIIYIFDVIRGRWGPADLEKKVMATAQIDAAVYGQQTQIRIPKDPGGAGKFQAHLFVAMLQGYPCTIEAEDSGHGTGGSAKERRADPLAAQCEHGFVKLIEGPWNDKFVEEMAAFGPNCAHDDQVDAAAAAFRTLFRRNTMSAVGA